MDEGWINGGYFVMEPKIFDYLKNDKTFLEREPMEKVSKKKQLVAFKNYSFWQCVDTIRDKEILEKLLKKKMRENILITGGTGFIGFHLIKKLKKNLI